MASDVTDPSRRRGQRRPPAAEITSMTPIWCPACQEAHPAAEFPKNASRPSGLQSECKRAARARARTTEAKAAANAARREKWKRPEVKAAALERQRARRARLGSAHDLNRSRQRLQSVVTEWKRTGCVDCGYSDVRALDPDHRDPGRRPELSPGWCSCARARTGFWPSWPSARCDALAAIVPARCGNGPEAGTNVCHRPGRHWWMPRRGTMRSSSAQAAPIVDGAGGHGAWTGITSVGRSARMFPS